MAWITKLFALDREWRCGWLPLVGIWLSGIFDSVARPSFDMLGYADRNVCPCRVDVLHVVGPHIGRIGLRLSAFPRSVGTVGLSLAHCVVLTRVGSNIRWVAAPLSILTDGPWTKAPLRLVSRAMVLADEDPFRMVCSSRVFISVAMHVSRLAGLYGLHFDPPVASPLEVSAVVSV